MPNEQPVEPANPIDAKIYIVRGQSVMLDSDLASVYDVTTSQLNQAVKRNERRFPPSFSFVLADKEWESLRSQIVTLKGGRGQHRKYPPRVFTEHGAVMLAAVLNSDRAVDASIAVVDAFVRLRRVLQSNQTLARRIDELEKRVVGHDRTITVIFHELKKLVAGEQPGVEPEQPKRRIGYRTSKEQEAKSKNKRRKTGK